MNYLRAAASLALRSARHALYCELACWVVRCAWCSLYGSSDQMMGRMIEIWIVISPHRQTPQKTHVSLGGAAAAHRCLL